MSDQTIDLSGTFDEWLKTVPDYQQRILIEMSESGKHIDDLPALWLSSSVTPDSSAYGSGGFGKSIYYDHFLNHIHDLLCSPKKEFADQRNSLLKDAGLGKAALVAGITHTISPMLVAAPALLAPAVAVLLFVIGQLGIRTWCSVQTERRRTSGA